MELNCDWIDDFDKQEHFFDDFYKETVQNLRLYCLYINKKRELFHIKKDILSVNDGILNKEHLIYLLNKYRTFEKAKFQPLSILKYNIYIDPEDIDFFLTQENNADQFLSVQPKIDSIKWQDTITLFQDLNAVFFIYNEKVKNNNTTKKGYIGRRRRKTKRKFT